MNFFSTTRKSGSLAIAAMLFITALILPVGTAVANTKVRRPAVLPPSVEVVFVLDTTGSMSGLIAAAKEKIWSIANTLASAQPEPEIRMGLVGYRDRGDAYITTMTPLTDDLDRVYADLMAYRAGGGGDGPESVNQALYEAVTRMDWMKNAHRAYQVIFLVGDAPPHMDYQDDVRYQKSCQMAAKRSIIINTIQCGNQTNTTPIWKNIAHLSKGSYFHVSQSGSAVLHKTPFDEKIAALSHDLDGTRLYYGTSDHIARMAARKKQSDRIYESAAPAAVAQRTLFNAKKAGKKNFLGGQELVQAVEDGTVELEKIEKAHLPKDLRHLQPERLKAVVEDRIQKRKALRDKITDLSEKRQRYIEEKLRLEIDAGASSLDAKIYSCIKTQAAKVNINYTKGPTY